MKNETIEATYRTWCACATEDADVVRELSRMEEDTKRKEDAFYRDLSFGTGGLRGVIGAGTNRLNIHTVARASQGLVHYIKKNFPEELWRVAVSYDSRIKSDVFARVAAEVFAAAGLRVFLYEERMPTPCLSFAARELFCALGVMVTASHNPSQYNGYKVYGADGCQITTEAAKAILKEIQTVDMFNGVSRAPFTEQPASGQISYIGEEVITAFIGEVKKQSVLSPEESEKLDRNVAIVYTPLNGTGLKPVLRALRESGYTNITVVKEQEQPDGHFPTCPYPNPEEKEAMTLGLEYAGRCHADLLLATDPDCDRVGIGVKNSDGEYVLLSGNETGMLLLDYICTQRQRQGTMPEDPVFMKTIVTTDMGERIAADYGVRTVNVLTGFKFIGEQIGVLEEKGKKDSFIFGFEESYGYLSGDYVRDKDGVGASLLICEMYAWYYAQGISLWERLEQLYTKYGYCINTLHSYTFEGSAGFDRMQEIMKKLRSTELGEEVIECLDYSQGRDGLPPSDVLKFILKGNCSVIIRPSGTEPKLKTYLSICGESREAAEAAERQIVSELNRYMR